MKKRVCFSVVVLSILVLLCSCLSTYIAEKNISDSEANEAMHVVLTKAVNSTNKRFFQKVNSYSFFPESYSIIAESKDAIPGMNTIIDSWNSYVSNYLIENKETIETQTSAYTENLDIENGLELVNASNTSGSEFLDSYSRNDFLAVLTELVSGMDFSKLNVAVSQYNAWVKTENFRKSTNVPALLVNDVTEELVTLIHDIYKNTVSMYEELYRTTPDPYTEEIILKVFGIS